jgi:hypothetical protein
MALNGPKESKKRFDADAVRNRWVLIDRNRNLQIIDVPSQDVVKVLNNSVCTNIGVIRLDPFNPDRLYVMTNSTTLGIVNLSDFTTSTMELHNSAIDIGRNPDLARRELYTSGDVLIRSTDHREIPADYTGYFKSGSSVGTVPDSGWLAIHGPQADEVLKQGNWGEMRSALRFYLRITSHINKPAKIT